MEYKEKKDIIYALNAFIVSVEIFKKISLYGIVYYISRYCYEEELKETMKVFFKIPILYYLPDCILIKHIIYFSLLFTLISYYCNFSVAAYVKSFRNKIIFYIS